MRLLPAVLTLALLPTAAICQTMLESASLSGAITASASGTAAATGSALAKSLGSLDASLARAATGGPSTALSGAARTPPAPPLPKPLQAAFDGLEPGMLRTDLIARAGKPQFAIASSDDELIRYTTQEGGSVRIRIAEGKILSIEQTPPKSAATPPPTQSTVPAK